MRKVSFPLLALVLTLAMTMGIGIANADMGEDWPTFHHDLALSGYIDSQAPDTNAVAWTYDIGLPVESSPAVVDGILYIGGLDGKLHALSAHTGSVVWTYSTAGSIYSSPAVADGKVYFLVDDIAGDNMYALDAATGALIWSEDIGSGNWDWSSPAVHGGSVFIATSDGYVHSLNAGTGASNWSRYVGGEPDSPIAVVNGTVYSGTHNFDNTNSTLVALDEATGNVSWTYDYHLYHSGIVGMINSNGVAVVDGDGDGDLEVYFGVYNWEGVDDQAVCLDEATGAEVWTADIGGDSTSTPAVHNGTVFIGSDDGKVYALDAGTGSEKWSFQTGDWVWASPVVADGKVFVGSWDHTLYALDEEDGTEVWSYYTGASRLMGSPAVADGMVFVGNENGKVYAFYPISVDKELADSWPDEILADDDERIEVGEKWYFELLITVINNDAENPITDLVVKDNLGGDLELNYVDSEKVDPSQGKKDTWTNAGGNVTVLWTGKTNKVHLTWDVGTLNPGDSVSLTIQVSTDMNTGHGNGKNLKFPNGHQEYTEAGTHYLNSGATTKGTFLGEQVSAISDSIWVEVVEAG